MIPWLCYSLTLLSICSSHNIGIWAVSSSGTLVSLFCFCPSQLCFRNIFWRNSLTQTLSDGSVKLHVLRPATVSSFPCMSQEMLSDISFSLQCSSQYKNECLVVCSWTAGVAPQISWSLEDNHQINNMRRNSGICLFKDEIRARNNEWLTKKQGFHLGGGGGGEPRGGPPPPGNLVARREV